VIEIVQSGERAALHLRWARASMEATISAFAAARAISEAEAEDRAWALAVAREHLADLAEHPWS
jgi:hypothetical protein